ncbi:MAG: ATP-binding protein [Planctomycetes bacterium]|nr:ATP-binding protein [Planctomycetota bacterium]
MNRSTLCQIYGEAVSHPLPTGRRRQLRLPTDTGKVIALAGVRRSGKTFLLFDTMRQLLDHGVDRRQMIHLNFEDDRLQPLQPRQLDLIVRCHREVFPDFARSRLYLFLDEVQAAPGWERWVRRLHDTENISIFVTGSSSKLLTRNLSTAMRGRSVTFEVFPLSFAEFVSFRGLPATATTPAAEQVLADALVEYLRWGGFPEVVLAEPAMRPMILDEYAAVMLHRDLAEQRGVRNELLMRAVLRHCYRNTATLLSTSKLLRDLRSTGLSFGKNTLFRYLQTLEASGLVFQLPTHARSLRKQANNPKKLHVIDTGLIAAFLPGADRDLGHRLETAVFLECRRRQRDWHWLRDQDAELDLCDPEERWFLNSCWRLDEPATLAREAAAVALGRTTMPGARGNLIVHEPVSPDTATALSVVPAWRWLLDPPTFAVTENQGRP